MAYPSGQWPLQNQYFLLLPSFNRIIYFALNGFFVIQNMANQANALSQISQTLFSLFSKNTIKTTSKSVSCQ